MPTATTTTRVAGARLATAAGGLGAVGLLAVVAGLALTGGAAASLVADPGAVTRWGLPLAKVVDDVAACVTVGLLVVAAVALPAPEAGRRRAGQPSDLLTEPALPLVRYA